MAKKNQSVSQTSSCITGSILIFFVLGLMWWSFNSLFDSVFSEPGNQKEKEDSENFAKIEISSVVFGESYKRTFGNRSWIDYPETFEICFTNVTDNLRSKENWGVIVSYNIQTQSGISWEAECESYFENLSSSNCLKCNLFNSRTKLKKQLEFREKGIGFVKGKIKSFSYKVYLGRGPMIGNDNTLQSEGRLENL